MTDSQCLGDNLQFKQEGATRTMTHDVFSLSSKGNASRTRDLYQEIQKKEVDAMCMREHKLDANQHGARQTLQDSAEAFGRCMIEAGSSETETITAFKPGGTGIIAQGNVTGRIKDRFSDKCGRWSAMEMQGKDTKTAMATSACQACARPANKHGGSAFNQQETAFVSENRC